VVNAAVKVKGAAKLCVVTGGEPFRQYQMVNLVRELLLHFDTVQIETSGSCFQWKMTQLKLIHKDRIQIVCSPKTPKLHKELVPLIDAYKYVVRFGHVDDDGLPNEEPQQHKKISVAKPHDPNVPVFISPWDEQCIESNALNVQQAVDSCLTHGYHLSLQVHKIVNLP
jgi:organic radical activating enzyme